LAVDVVSPAANARQINTERQKETAGRRQKETGGTKSQQKLKTKSHILLKEKNKGGESHARGLAAKNIEKVGKCGKLKLCHLLLCEMCFNNKKCGLGKKEFIQAA